MFKDYEGLQIKSGAGGIAKVQSACSIIDFLQIRWDKVWIYKPDAKFNPVKSLHQIYLYKLAIHKRTGIPLENICAAYFDDKDYFELREN